MRWRQAASSWASAWVGQGRGRLSRLSIIATTCWGRWLAGVRQIVPDWVGRTSSSPKEQEQPVSPIDFALDLLTRNLIRGLLRVRLPERVFVRLPVCRSASSCVCRFAGARLRAFAGLPERVFVRLPVCRSASSCGCRSAGARLRAFAGLPERVFVRLPVCRSASSCVCRFAGARLRAVAGLPERVFVRLPGLPERVFVRLPGLPERVFVPRPDCRVRRAGRQRIVWRSSAWTRWPSV